MKQFTLKQKILGFLGLLGFGIEGMVVSVIKADPQYQSADKKWRQATLKLQSLQQKYCNDYPDTALACVRKDLKSKNTLYYQNVEKIKKEAHTR